jgi:hypothetical protein
MGKKDAPELLPGALDLLILKALAAGSLHGYGIVNRLRTISEEVGENSLYPALQRLLLNGWVKAEWGASENNRRAAQSDDPHPCPRRARWPRGCPHSARRGSNRPKS